MWFVVFILIIVAMIIISFVSNEVGGNSNNIENDDSKVVANDDSKISENGIFIFDDNTSIKLTNTDVVINNEKTIKMANIEKVKINKNTEYMLFNKNCMLAGGVILLFLNLISFIIIGAEVFFMEIWLCIFILSFIQGAIIGGLKKKFINSKIYFYLKDGNVEMVNIKHRSNRIEGQLHKMEILSHNIKKEGIEI